MQNQNLRSNPISDKGEQEQKKVVDEYKESGHHMTQAEKEPFLAGPQKEYSKCTRVLLFRTE